MYDGVKGVSDHIMLLSFYCNKLKGLKMNIGEEFLSYSIMKSLPSHFDNIRSSLNTEKEGCSLEELKAILVKEEDDIKLNRSIHCYGITSSIQVQEVFPKEGTRIQA